MLPSLPSEHPSSFKAHLCLCEAKFGFSQQNPLFPSLGDKSLEIKCVGLILALSCLPFFFQLFFTLIAKYCVINTRSALIIFSFLVETTFDIMMIIVRKPFQLP